MARRVQLQQDGGGVPLGGQLAEHAIERDGALAFPLILDDVVLDAAQAVVVVGRRRVVVDLGQTAHQLAGVVQLGGRVAIRIVDDGGRRVELLHHAPRQIRLPLALQLLGDQHQLGEGIAAATEAVISQVQQQQLGSQMLPCQRICAPLRGHVTEQAVELFNLWLDGALERPVLDLPGERPLLLWRQGRLGEQIDQLGHAHVGLEAVNHLAGQPLLVTREECLGGTYVLGHAVAAHLRGERLLVALEIALDAIDTLERRLGTRL